MYVTGVRWPRPRAEAQHGRATPAQEPIDPPPARSGIEQAGLTQKQAARLLGVSVGWLRASACPKVFLPGNGPRGKPMLRYFRDDVLAWAGRRVQQEAPGSASAVRQSLADGGSHGKSLRESLETPMESPDP